MPRGWTTVTTKARHFSSVSVFVAVPNCTSAIARHLCTVASSRAASSLSSSASSSWFGCSRRWITSTGTATALVSPSTGSAACISIATICVACWSVLVLSRYSRAIARAIVGRIPSKTSRIERRARFSMSSNTWRACSSGSGVSPCGAAASAVSRSMLFSILPIATLSAAAISGRSLASSRAASSVLVAFSR